MAADSTDALMMFEYTTSDPKRSGNGKVAAEGASMFSSWSKTGKGWTSGNDALMEDFEPGYFFEVDTFDFGVGVNDGEGGSGAAANAGAGGGGGGKMTNSLHGGKPADQKQGSNQGAEAPKPAKPRFSRFIYPPVVRPGQKKPDLDYDIDVHPFSFSRQMDMASPIFLEHCASVTPFAKAILVKRKFTGNLGFHESYLRIVFTDVLLTGVEWDDGEFIKEKCSFVYRQIDVSYRPQKQDGTLDKSVPGTWKAKRKTQGSEGVL
jgi:type VI protein secretion system component Hcp